MPRSGTTWVGRTLGDAPDALYFNEPLSEVHVAQGGGATFFEVDPSDAPGSYTWPARFAAAGVPAFGPRTVGEGFGVVERLGKRVVIKEVNPLAVDWLIATLRPRLVYLVRHPAAVAVSIKGRGWDWPVFEQRFLPGRALPSGVPDTYWGRIGAIQGIALSMAPSFVVQFEDFCREPLARFRALYDYCDLTWTDAVAAMLGERTGGEITRGAEDPAGITRNTPAVADAWRSEISQSELDHVRAGWMATDPTRYAADEDWARSG